ncbi:unnamed protein product, partial [Rotaria magnacalcarata]
METKNEITIVRLNFIPPSGGFARGHLQRKLHQTSQELLVLPEKL